MLYYFVLPHTLVFKNLAITSRGAYRERSVWYLFLSYRPLTLEECQHLLVSPDEWGSGRVGVGEIAPLYDLSSDYTDGFEEVVDSCCRRALAGSEPDFEAFRSFPSICFGVETAWLSLHSRDGVSLIDSAFARGQGCIRINGLVWMGSIEQMTEGLEAKARAGFKCIKCKIGAHDFEQEKAFLREMRRRYPREQFQLRLDANGAYTKGNVMNVLEELSHFDVHSIEQPIKQGRWMEMKQLCAKSPIPIALDEELIGINQRDEKQKLLEIIAPQYIVLKPTLHGGMRGTLEWIEIAKQLGIGYWITSALESNVGLNAVAQLAASVEGAEPWQGLGTGGLFEQNIENLGLKLEGECMWREIYA